MIKRHIFSLIAVRGIGSLIQLLVIVVLGNYYSSAMIGEYYVFLTWLYLFSIIASIGLPVYLLKEVSAKDSLGMYLESSKIFFTALLYVLIFSFVIFIFIYILREIQKDLFQNIDVLVMSSLGAVFLVIIKIFSETLKAKDLQSHGFFLEFVMPQSIVVVTLLGFGIFGQTITIGTISTLYIVSYIFTIFLAIVLHKKTLFSHTIHVEFGIFDFKNLLPLWGTQLINSLFSSLPYLIFPLFYSMKEVGFFAVAHRLFGLSSTLILVLSSYYSPLFSKSYTRNNHNELAMLYNKSRWLSFSLFLPLTLIIIIYPEQILKIFSPELVNDTVINIVIIFFVVRQFSLLFGLTESFLYMTGKGFIELITSSISIFLGTITLLYFENKNGLSFSASIFIFFYTIRIVSSYGYIKYKAMY